MAHLFHNQHATLLAQQYLSKSFEDIHQSWFSFLTPVLSKKHVRNTIAVRKRFEQLNITNNPQHCVWTQRTLANHRKQSNIQIDHSSPFARWPNNDLWNLLPTDAKANGEKCDRLPTAQRMNNAKAPISDWWQSAWLDNKDASLNANISRQFFAQANIALPGLNSDNTSIDDLFGAMELQRGRLKEMQQLREW